MKRTFVTVVFALLIAVGVTYTLGQFWTTALSVAAQKTKTEIKENVDAKALLLASADACLKVRTVEYAFDHQTVKDNGPGYDMPSITAAVRQERADVPRSGIAGKLQASGTISLPESAPQSMSEMVGMKPGQRKANFTFAYDGLMYQLLNPRDRTMLIVKPPNPQVIIRLRDSAGLLAVGVPQFTDPAPFKRTMETASDFVYLGTADIAGVKCHIVGLSRLIVNPDKPDKSTTIKSRYFIGVDDLLPRRMIIGNIQNTIRITKLNQPFGQDAFTIAMPTGYNLKMVTEEDSRRLFSGGLLAAGTIAPDWKLRDAEGQERSLGDYRGKIVVLDFWATWCGPCIAAMPVMQAIHKKYEKEGVVVIGVSIKEEKGADPLGFIKNKGFTYQLLLNGDPIVSAYKADALPTFYIIGKDRQIIYSKRGYSKLETDELGDVIDQYLKDGSFRRTRVRGD